METKKRKAASFDLNLPLLTLITAIAVNQESSQVSSSASVLRIHKVSSYVMHLLPPEISVEIRKVNNPGADVLIGSIPFG